MKKLSSRNTPGIIKGNFVCATNYSISYCDGLPTLTNVVEHLQCAESADTKSCDRTSAMSTKIETSSWELDLRCVSLLTAVLTTCFHLLQDITLSRMQLIFSAINWQLHGQPMCTHFGTKMNVPTPEYINEEAPSVGRSLLWRQEKEYAIKKDEIPESTMDMESMSEQSSDKNAASFSVGTVNPYSVAYSHEKYSNNRQLSRTPSFKTVASSTEYLDLPPVLHLHKEPIAINFPAYMSCAISQRPSLSDIQQCST